MSTEKKRGSTQAWRAKLREGGPRLHHQDIN